MLKVTLRGLFLHKARFILTLIAVVVGVGFVVGTFTLTDTVRTQLNQLFVEINGGVDLTVRAVEEFESGNAFGAGAPIPESIVADIEPVEGVAYASGVAGGVPAFIIKDGIPAFEENQAPVGGSWGTNPDDPRQQLVEGSAPVEDDEVALDIDAAEKWNIAPGDRVVVQTPLGNGEYRLSGTFSFGANNATTGAVILAFTLPEAQRQFNLEGQLQNIEITLAEGADAGQVQAEIAALLPEGVEVVDTAQVVGEQQSDIGEIINIFSTVLLVFAGVTLFVSAFLIFNTFLIVVGQRVRELALLRAIGASTTQVAWSILGEAALIGVIASIVGFGFGIVVAAGLNAVLNAGGFGTGSSSLVIEPRNFLLAFGVAMVTTVVSALIPARRSTKVPPVAAMQSGYVLQLGTVRRLAIIGGVFAVVGGLLIGWGLSGLLDGIALATALGLGALIVFIGVALLSGALAKPMASAIGKPITLVSRVTGKLARENASRQPTRTAFTAAALMIGLALVSMTFVVGTSLKTSFGNTLRNGVQADWYVTTDSFFGFSPEVVERLQALPELTAVSGLRQGPAQVDGSVKQLSAVDYSVIAELFDLDITEGSVGPGDEGLLIGTDVAADRDLAPGDEIDIVFQETGTVTLPILAVMDNTSALGNWVIDLDTYGQQTAEQVDVFAAARTAEGVSEADARAVIESSLIDYPQIKIRDSEEFISNQQSQIDGLLVVVNVFLLLSIIIAMVGIVNTLALAVYERTRELGMLRAMGMGRRQTRRMIRLEAIIVSIFGALLGIVVGVAFGVMISTALPDDIINEIVVPFGNLISLIVIAAVLGVLAAVFPAWRAGRLNILEAIATE